MRNGSEQMGGNLRLFVVPHLHFECHGHGGDAPPFCGASAPTGVEIAYVHRFVYDKVPAASAILFTLSGFNVNARSIPYPLHCRPLVLPPARFPEFLLSPCWDSFCHFFFLSFV